MALGNPEFGYGDIVNFKMNHFELGELELSGTIEIVDAYGVFEDDSRAYYDILVKPDPHYGEDGCLYKHVPEDDVWQDD